MAYVSCDIHIIDIMVKSVSHIEKIGVAHGY